MPIFDELDRINNLTLTKAPSINEVEAQQRRLEDLRQDLIAAEMKKQFDPPGPLEKKTDRMLQFFQYVHLPPHLQEVSRPFCDLANRIVQTLPQNQQCERALEWLLTAKDCAVRALLYKEELANGPQS